MHSSARAARFSTSAWSNPGTAHEHGGFLRWLGRGLGEGSEESESTSCSNLTVHDHSGGVSGGVPGLLRAAIFDCKLHSRMNVLENRPNFNVLTQSFEQLMCSWRRRGIWSQPSRMKVLTDCVEQLARSWTLTQHLILHPAGDAPSLWLLSAFGQKF